MPTVVTSALPYANGSIHLGHMVEYIQADIFARFLKMTGEDAIYVCADDTHGAPVELKARELGITPEDLIERVHAEHSHDFSDFQVDFDIFYTTNSPENRGQAEFIYQNLRKHNVIERKRTRGVYCEHDERFLPDRYVLGNCPRCGAPDQYGDSCEACGSTYDPQDLKNAKCSLCGRKPVTRESEHLFFQLSKCADFLKDWTHNSGALKPDVANSVGTWLKEGLRDWCISRDKPYFGFHIPGETDKYFYVWLDAPIGYISSTQKYCEEHGLVFDDFWRSEDSRVYHFIGKDIVYFHSLFWPAMLKLSGYHLPDKVFVHGFLTINGEKMSKSRGTFVMARDYLNIMGKDQGPTYLRFYYGSKLTGRNEDLDLSIEDFHLKVNAGLIHNLCNFHNRSFTFCKRKFEGKLGTLPSSHPLMDLVEKTVPAVAEHYRQLEYNRALEKILELGDAGNKFFQDSAPWDKVKSDPAAAQADITLCVNLVKVIAVLLKPVAPSIASAVENQLDSRSFKWSDATMNLEKVGIGEVEKLAVPIDPDRARTIIQDPAEETPDPQGDSSGPPLISYDEFSKLDLRVAKIRKAEPVPKTSKLLKLEVETGGEIRTLVAGIAEHYAPDELTGTQVVIVANLAPAKIRGVESQGMILAAQSGKKLIVVRPECEAESGSRVA